MTHAERFVEMTKAVLDAVEPATIEQLALMIADTRERGGRLFVLGVGGSAATASHAVGDFRKLAHIEAYAPSDNSAELTARMNDEGWETTFSAWLRVSRLTDNDTILVLSVGGGDREANISTNIVAALDHAVEVGAGIAAVVGRDGGHAATVSDVCVLIPTVEADMVTAMTEAFHGVVLHAVVSHPAVQRTPFKWESSAG